MDHIILKGLQFYAKHGYLKEEAVLGQRFVVDLELSLDLQPAGSSDDLSQSVSYADVYTLVREHVEGKRFQLIETLGEHICQSLLSTFELLEQVSIRIAKPQVPLPGVLDCAAVELTRSRN